MGVGAFSSSAHPTGSVLAIGETLVWSYVNPIGDAEHHGCVMIWRDGEAAKVWLTSERTGSDWMMARKSDTAVWLIERFQDPAIDRHRFRVLEAVVGEKPEVVRDWALDEHRVGEGGFTMLSENEILFARYPDVFVMELGSAPRLWKPNLPSVNGLRALEDGRLLLRLEDGAVVVSADGEAEREWRSLRSESLDAEFPFGGNRIFDVALRDDELWLAYWGMRRFDRWTNGSNGETILQLDAPWLPHAVATSSMGTFLLASSFDPGNEVRPRLWRWREGALELIWEVD